VEPLSLDEAFLDVRGVARTSGTPLQTAIRLRTRIVEEVRLTASIGIASTKFLSKLATERAKPTASPEGPIHGSGIHHIVEGAELDFLHPLGVGALWGVGPATLARLSAMGVETVGDLAAMPESRVLAALGAATGGHLHRLSRGIDDRPVVTNRRAKSVSQEETFARDLLTRDELALQTVRLADALASRLRAGAVRARTISVKIRFTDFTTITRSATGGEPIDGARAIAEVARDLVAEVDPTPGVRLFGISGSGLVDSSAQQLTFDDVSGSVWGDAAAVVGEIRQRFGNRSIGPAVLAGPGQDIQVREQGSGQWGPAR
jgi:DNA polymerase-4